jgi:DNA-3-methyladenine glycosylase II
MTPRTAAVAVDHPGWLTNHHGHTRRASHTGDTLWAAIHKPTATTFTPTIEIIQPGTVTKNPIIDRFDPTILPPVLHHATPVRDNVPIGRIRNPSLWDALIPPLLHQRRTATEAANQYRRLCATHGRTITTTAGPALLPPHPETVAVLPDQTFIDLRLRGKQEHLRTAAKAYLTHADHWATLSPAELFTELQTIPYIGAATAGTAVADLTNDYSFHTLPAHTAYHHWQKLVADPCDTPTQDDFTTAWTQLDHEQRSTLIVILLTRRGDGVESPSRSAAAEDGAS